VHIGLHKTGTTYLQQLWHANRDQLAAAGICFPGATGEPSQRLAALDVLGHRPRGASDSRIAGQWQALCRLVAGSDLPAALVSAEGLSVATPRQAAAVVAGFGDREVRVVVTCRDLGRVLVSSWQEAVKNDGTWTWDEYAAAVRDESARGRSPGRGFWLAQDLPAILAAWAGAVGAAHVHVVTVPPAGTAPDELATRVASVVGYDAAVLTASPPRENVSLGVAGLEVLRRLNVSLDHRLNQRQHDHLVKTFLTRHLVAHAPDHRFGLPEADLPWVADLAQRQIDAVARCGYPVVGDLDDLRPRTDPEIRAPGDAPAEEVAAAALVALQGISERYAAKWWRQQRRRGESLAGPVPPASRRSSGWRAASFRTRRYVAGLADSNRLVGSVVGRYLSRRRS
jgi:hypothetical protein